LTLILAWSNSSFTVSSLIADKGAEVKAFLQVVYRGRALFGRLLGYTCGESA
jgi:hypothetical protein